MAWVESHQGLSRHPKTTRAARLLEVKKVQVIGHLHELWWWALDYAQDGNLTSFDPQDIAAAAAWEGDPASFVEALLLCGKDDGPGFLERRAPDGALVLHDWYEYAGKLIEKRASDRERKRRSIPPGPGGAIAGNGTGKPGDGGVKVEDSPKKAETQHPTPRQDDQDPEHPASGAPKDGRRNGVHLPGEFRRNSAGIPLEVAGNRTVPKRGEEGAEEAPPPAADRGPSPRQLFEAWNANRGGMAAARGLTDERARKAKVRLRDVPDLDRWAAAIRRLAASSFATGTNDRNWIADFDFLLRPDSLIRIEEGKYDNHRPGGSGASRPKVDNAASIREHEDWMRKEGLLP